MLKCLTYSRALRVFHHYVCMMTVYITGMSSTVAMTKHSGGVAKYRSSEGKAVSIPFRGPISGTINDILGGIRSSCTYVGAS
jgi:IMP dehydrogenase/GMP reductase